MLNRPPWLKVKLPLGDIYSQVRRTVDNNHLNTICESGKCPNLGECWGAGTATFMILGDICTRSCSFCAVQTGKPDNLDFTEPKRIAEAVRAMKLKHIVITSVNRDELPDKGMGIWAATVNEIKNMNQGTTIEALIPDVHENWVALDLLINEKPEIISHNMETVKRLYKLVRPQAKYERSITQLKYLKERGVRTKSGIMLGIGETEDEIIELMDDLVNVNVDVFTLGQYLQPTKEHLSVEEFISPEKFLYYKQKGIEMGFNYIESGPLVRSSYHSERHLGK